MALSFKKQAQPHATQEPRSCHILRVHELQDPTAPDDSLMAVACLPTLDYCLAMQDDRCGRHRTLCTNTLSSPLYTFTSLVQSA